ncbi:MAG: division/cell wall cluster transcriptional repressor MraZ [Janthinobacterium lividum]|uniref:Transcriptional regulator MraZ n=4 Tax=Rickettsia bellii TaxID=33990 RepID=MRAZ_RICBR|nr:division/cell wall cluster transcriptional repressor MraZ [Rickettsia bellii]A8GVV5.1 RecName: Full=Transcriptional regulator MraZ [Rickettsia bellii OSU 85-389]Q1RJ44.1 RecName: Full=Transcriptional regulator MraZ [Rickettsia bellii RML369-C]MCC8370115.1 division/cell wall cluster transcriptional repressor MraZ [Rickettsia endosymbiont of Stiretrus anchorago]MCC8377122.1 division/cell wall cluster transcriptional repressor MraZ [Rickettsia endosymbiont of Graphium doson]HJD65182.1 division
MNIFLSKFINNNIDKKGRVSVPANYRAVLGKEAFNGIIAYPSIRNNCIEACGISHIEKLRQMIESLDPYSEERDAFETIIFGEAVQLSFDGEGRVILPASLMQHAGIEDQVCFVGKGVIFEIWQPQNFKDYLASAQKLAHEKRLTLRNTN